LKNPPNLDPWSWKGNFVAHLPHEVSLNTIHQDCPTDIEWHEKLVMRGA
jgi:hypothetical protein